MDKVHDARRHSKDPSTCQDAINAEIYSEDVTPVYAARSYDVLESSRRSVAKLVSTLHDSHVPQAVCSSILSQCEKLAKTAVNEARQSANAGDVEGLPSIRSLKEFHSEHKFQRYVQSELPYIPPRTIELNQEGDKKHSYQYVSLVDQVKEIVKLPHLRDDIFGDVRSPRVQTHCFRDVFDGTAHVPREKDVVFLAISYDDFEVTNPLGTAATYHKVSALHFSVLNVPVEGRSKVDSLFLLILCLTSYVTAYGWRLILEPLIRDLCELVSGIEVFADGCSRNVRAKLLFICGDNLALHSIAGFVENFSGPKSPCRYCLGSPEDWQRNFHEKDFDLRHQATYEAQLRAVIDSDFDRGVISDCGIKAECQFSAVPGFNVAESFPPDIGHDILTGVIPYTISLVLTTIIRLKYASLSLLNKRIARFPWKGETNKPSFLKLFKGKIKVKQTACQAWTLLRYLPILLGDLVPENCAEWMVLTDLCGIVESIFAWKFTRGDLEFIADKITEWLCRLKQCYPTFRLKPKFHFMVHYATQIKKHGPLRHCWTLRYESKYAFLKGLIKENKNFVNITKTIAKKHQIHMAFKLQSTGLSAQEARIVRYGDAGLPNEVTRLVCVEGAQVGLKADVCGTLFEKGQAVMIEHETYEFGEVAAVCVHNRCVRLVLRPLTCTFHKHINAYEVCATDVWIVVDVSQLRCHKPLSIFEQEFGRFVVTKSYA